MASADLRREAERLFARNRLRGRSAETGLAYDCVCPSPTHYPFQWFWDSCFHAIALASIDLARACGEIACLLQAARPDGFVPHILFWDRAAHARAIAEYSLPPIRGWTSDTPQPPVLGTTLRWLHDAGAPRDFLAQTAAAALALYDWWERERDPDGDGLVSVFQPDETGLDAAPQFDAPLGLTEPTEPALRAAMQRLFAAHAPYRGDQAALAATRAFDVESVLVNVIYAQGRRDLARVLDALGRAAEAARCRAAAARTEAALLDRCWDAAAAAFWDLWQTPAGAEQPLRVRTVSSLMPLALETLPGAIAAALVGQMRDPRRFAAPFPCPSVALDEPTFDPGPGIIWRGPTWINTNWYLAHGLRRHGFVDEAAALAASSRELVLRAGFREYYNPFTGAGHGAESFGWSTLVIAMP